MSVKTPITCPSCRTQYFIREDYIRCRCGRPLYRVAVGPNGELHFPPEMPGVMRLEAEAQMRALTDRANALGMSTQEFYRQAMWQPTPPAFLDRVAGAFYNGEGPAEDFYASWEAFDLALERMPVVVRSEHRRAEVAELERWARL